MNNIVIRKEISYTKKLVMIGLLGAISAVLMLFQVQLPIFPSFVKLDFAEMPVILGGFMMGPMEGFFIALVKILLNLILNGTQTMFVGEAANLIASITYMLPAVWIYSLNRTKKGALYGLSAGVIITSFTAILGNMYVVFPVYAKAFGMPLDALVAMGHAINPSINNMWTMMIFSILPFNLLKFGLVSVITFFVYKRLNRVINQNIG